MIKEYDVQYLIDWIKKWFDKNGKDCNAIIGISGGKDSTVVAKLCVEALGKDRVIGVLMPNGIQKDIYDSFEVCELLGIKSVNTNIKPIVDSFYETINLQLNNKFNNSKISEKTKTNLPPRVRMSMLYAIAQTLNGRVVNTSNYSEYMLGWGTRWGDTVGDLAPIRMLTMSQVVEVGDMLGLPKKLVHKVPMDGLTLNDDGSYKTDEDNLGVTYKDVDTFLSGHWDEIKDENVVNKISDLIKTSAFKRGDIPCPNLKYKEH